MDIQSFVSQAWQDHGNDAEGVWGRIADGIPLVSDGRGAFLLANVATHVAGEHLGRWDDGIALLDRIAALPTSDAATPEVKGIRRLQAALHHCAGRTADAARLVAEAHPGGGQHPDVPRIRMLAVAASALANHGRTADASAAFREAVGLASYGPTATDPAARDLAVTGNNLSCALELKPGRSDAERELMLDAARAGRRFWGLAGGWMEAERAEYRLALAHVAAGLPADGLRHAEECLRIIRENGSVPGEVFFAHEALARTRHASGDREGARRERDAAATVLPTIADEGFRSFCGTELRNLDGLLTA